MKKATLILLLLTAFSCARQLPLPEEDLSRKVSAYLSNGKVNSIAEDRYGQIWMATARGLNRYDGKYFHQYFHSEDSLSLPDDWVSDVALAPDGTLWVATLEGVAKMDEQGDFHRISPDGKDPNAFKLAFMPTGDVFAVFQSHVSVCRKGSASFVFALDTPESYGQAALYPGTGNTIWVVTAYNIYCVDSRSLELEISYENPSPVLHSYLTSDGLLFLSGPGRITLFNTRTRRFQPNDKQNFLWSALADSEVDAIYEPEKGKVLFATSRGPFLYDCKLNSLLSCKDLDFPYSIPDLRVSCLFTDSKGLLWIGSEDQGYAMSCSTSSAYGDKRAIREFFAHKSVAAVAATQEGNLWISTKRYGLFFCEPEKDRVVPVSIDAFKEDNPLGIDYCNRILVARDGSLWLCMLGSGKVFHARYEKGRLEADRVIEDLQSPDRLLETSDGAIWIGTVVGLVYRCTESETTAYSPFVSGQIKLVDGMMEWDGRRVLLSSSSGGLCLMDSTGKSEMLSDLPLTAPFMDRKGQVWTCVNGHEWKRIDEDGLQDTPLPPLEGKFYSVCEDRDGYFWVGTNSGLVRVDPEGGETFTFTEDDGLPGNEFADACAVRLPDGHLAFGGPQGITLFVPLSHVTGRHVPVRFQEFMVNGRLMKAVPDSMQVRLNHLQNNICISYAALDYQNQNRISYRYRMEGCDDAWIHAERGTEANYSHLPPGRYTFRVRAEDSAGGLIDNEASISIRILPDPWRSWWAILCYLFYGGVLIFIAYHEWRLRQRKIREAEAVEKLNTMQMNFFANVAHEFRTPLTMIAGPMSSLAASDRIVGGDRKMLGVMQRSVNWMLHLVNQLLDFNKLEGDSLALRVQKADIVPCLSQVVDGFIPNAQAKNIRLSTQGIEGGFQMWMDADKIVKIMLNLLSNAIKFTPEGGQVEVSMDILSRDRAALLFPLKENDRDSRYLYVSVKDNGPGIPEASLERIFERFYQLRRGQAAIGSGIGLYYSRSLASIHHGYLKAWNRTDLDSGAIFGLLLPAGESSYTDEERSAPQALAQTQLSALQVQNNGEVSAEGKRNILVVDDDVDIANYLKIMLQPHYSVRLSFDVDSALAALEEQAPDLVLSDVMMPGRSGYDLCEAIKENLQLCHIPVILVTAMDKVSSQVEGLERGADAYVTKPFDPAYLLALIGSQLENRDKLRSQLGRAVSAAEVEQTRMSPQDKAFMKALYRLMDSELSNPELDVSTLTEKLRISRSKFYYKVKGLTGENPGDFFRRYKLNKAAGLLLEGKLNISEIADPNRIQQPFLFLILLQEALRGAAVGV